MKTSLVLVLAIAIAAPSERALAHTPQPADVKSLAQPDLAATENKIAEPAPADPEASKGNETLVVSFQFPRLSIDPALARYLDLSPKQLRTMQRLISKERREIEPLKAQLQTSHEKLLAAAGQGQPNRTEALAAAEARILTRLLIKSAHMQATLRNLLTAEQQKKLEELGTYSER